MWLSTLMPIDPSTDAPTRVAAKMVDGAKVRVARKSGASLDVAAKRRGGKGSEA